MFGMGMNEVMIVLAIAVIVIGPKQLPQVARAMGKMVAQFKRATNDLRNTITDEVKEHVPMDEFNEMKDTLHSGVQDLQDHSRSLMHDESNFIGECDGRPVLHIIDDDFLRPGGLGRIDDACYLLFVRIEQPIRR